MPCSLPVRNVLFTFNDLNSASFSAVLHFNQCSSSTLFSSVLHFDQCNSSLYSVQLFFTSPVQLFTLLSAGFHLIQCSSSLHAAQFFSIVGAMLHFIRSSSLAC